MDNVETFFELLAPEWKKKPWASALAIILGLPVALLTVSKAPEENWIAQFSIYTIPVIWAVSALILHHLLAWVPPKIMRLFIFIKKHLPYRFLIKAAVFILVGYFTAQINKSVFFLVPYALLFFATDIKWEVRISKPIKCDFAKNLDHYLDVIDGSVSRDTDFRKSSPASASLKPQQPTNPGTGTGRTGAVAIVKSASTPEIGKFQCRAYLETGSLLNVLFDADPMANKWVMARLDTRDGCSNGFFDNTSSSYNAVADGQSGRPSSARSWINMEIRFYKESVELWLDGSLECKTKRTPRYGRSIGFMNELVETHIEYFQLTSAS